ncbi:RluA family pseudouridine synthase [Lacticaseibacillus hulanensis]|uniref:RluA family pseudouridine synthase n=1 Tax=Lacticaseibacillus hulanensis TaxID=2493111 RepID=UPI000FDA0778|nr:RluA family pseudouridine synthase [Lacticaseibacillus hulanensis]
MQNFTFSTSATKETTVKRLLADFGVSHRLFKRLLDSGSIKLEGKKTGNVTVHPGQSVTFTLIQDKAVTPSSGHLDVVFENANWLVVNKPAGLSSVPGPANPEDSLLNRAAGYLVDAGFAGAQPAIITRLDRDTVGLVLIAKHAFAQGRLDQLGPAAKLDKYYLALVSGVLPETSGAIIKPLGAAPDGIHQEVRADGKIARTNYKVVRRGQQTTLVELHLLTGRTHQIRVHMASILHPLVGDALYGGPTDRLTGQALIAARLEFADPFTGEQIKVSLPWPKFWAVV